MFIKVVADRKGPATFHHPHCLTLSSRFAAQTYQSQVADR